MTLPGAEVFERAGLLAWPGIEVEWDGDWVRRASQGYTKRANSVQCLDPADDRDAPARIAAARDWLEARGVQPVIRVTPLTGPNLLATLDAEGWRTVDQSHLFAMPLGETELDERATEIPLLDAGFLTAQEKLQAYSPTQAAGMRALLATMSVPATGLVVHADGEVVASALMAIAEGIVVTGNVVTHPAYRRQGLAIALKRTGLAWAYRNGATVAALNVAADNAAAQALYRSRGYVHLYDYAYRVPGAPA